MAHVGYKPSWGKYEKDIHSDNLETAVAATEAFTQEREQEVRTSSKARDFERSRKAAIAKEKPQWVKEKIKNSQKPDPLKKLLQGGSFAYGLQPAPGYILVESKEESKATESGIVIAPTIEDRRDSGTVIACGSNLVLDNSPNLLNCPCQIGDKILYKNHAGLKLTLQEKECYLMVFSDVLGVFKDA